ncbi:MAG: ABC transporter substrate-binding protein [Holosporaceae bacterium]|jgi:trehalose/maltose transport system substrate-binding protein|nr:ABC transporter substrate-binding protein [Holosporaceae bacterium]
MKKMTVKRFNLLKKTVFFAAAMAFSWGSMAPVSADTIRLAYRSKGCEMDLVRKALDAWMKKHNGEHTVDVIILPHSSSECYALYKQWFGAGSFDIDVLQADIAWLNSFSDYWQPLDEYCQDIDQSDYFDVIRENMLDNDGRIIALPMYADCGVMYYRRDLLEKYNKKVPETLEELYETALYIQNEERKDEAKKNRFYGLVYQAKAFEILTCNFAELLDAFGGTIVKAGKAEVNSPQGIRAIEFLVKCIRNIMSSSVLNYSEEDARGMFQSGNAVFMRNWPYAYALMNDPSTAVSGKIGVMVIPPSANGGKESGCLGGWFVAVSKYSKHKELAADLARFISSKEQQKIRVNFAYLPTFKSLYSDCDIERTNPFVVSMKNMLLNAVSRPSKYFHTNYQKASSEIYNVVNIMLMDSLEDRNAEYDPGRSLKRLNEKLNSLLSQPARVPSKQNAPEASEKENSAGQDGFFKSILKGAFAFPQKG